ncbi:hypothetical protein Bbelb_362760 [Branchiostoma belcheri]|nr:hypothetical protein Bbelb_421650 [Branchiostoma belcheri]KAI8485955.1 hypothetical protein Bbelb_362760 [Branchiostoma belcheri]
MDDFGLDPTTIDCSINQTFPNNCMVTNGGEILAKIAKAADGKKILPPLSPELGHAILARPGASLNLVHGPVGGGSTQFLPKSGYLPVLGALPAVLQASRGDKGWRW